MNILIVILQLILFAIVLANAVSGTKLHWIHKKRINDLEETVKELQAAVKYSTEKMYNFGVIGNNDVQNHNIQRETGQ